jgi:hypothetical protein
LGTGLGKPARGVWHSSIDIDMFAVLVKKTC